MKKRDPYEVLEIDRSASKDEVKAAYRRLAKKYHPDHYVDNPLAELAQAKFIEVQEAYETIIENKPVEEFDDNARENSKKQNQTYSQQRGEYSKGKNQSYENWQNSGSKNYEETDKVIFSQVRIMLSNRKVTEAKQILYMMNNETAEWYFLNGWADEILGNYSESLTYLKVAIQMEPNNLEYKKYYDESYSFNEQYEENKDKLWYRILELRIGESSVKTHLLSLLLGLLFVALLSFTGILRRRQ